MAENEVLVETTETEVAPEVIQTAEERKPSFGKKFLGGIKEWFRKFTVKLKLRPMNVAFFVLFVSSCVYLLLLGSLSQAGLAYPRTGVPISIFVNTLFSILVLLLFMYSFPKREKKPKIVMLVLTFVFMALMIALDILLFVQWTAAWKEACETFATSATGEADKLAREKFIYAAMNGALAHAVMLLVSAVLTATYPLYGKLIRKINTKKVIESTEIKGEIDTEQE